MSSNIEQSTPGTSDQQVESLFFKAILVEPENRNAFLHAECADDPELLNEVTGLLDCHQANEASGFILDQPAVPFDGERTPSNSAEISEAVGDTIGRYRLLKKIGEGGMADVYLAEQLEDVSRHVALKIIKLGMDTKQFIARFEAERQAMTMFNHPNIARVFDAGATRTGRPYLVIELVSGTDILSFANSKCMGINERLQLFVQVCHAVQHSHQKGIVHRDLKPSNIMITTVDEVPVPKVIDFGVARALHGRLTERTLFTQFASIIGTPQYMSPEQAGHGTTDIDTRADIYSLGILLYELTTGATPLGRQTIQQLEPVALLDTIRQQQVERPSTRFSKQKPEKLATWAEPVWNDPGKSHELDCIVMKAVAKDRSLRYPSATELAADLQRFLNGSPVEAVAPSSLYRLRSYIRRNPKTVLAVGAFVGLLIVSLAICSQLAWSTYRASLEKEETVSRLSSALHDLRAKHEKLVVAERTIRESAENQTYQAAVKSALTKFNWAFYQEIRHLLPVYIKKNENQQAETTADGSPGKVPFMQVVPHGCLDFDALLNLKNRELCLPELQRLKNCLQHLTSPASPNNDLVPGKIDENLKSELVKKAIQCRTKFFRILFTEYENLIGEKDPKNARTLNLLALSLVESGQMEEGMALLQKAISISDDESTINTSWAILNLLPAK